MTWHKYRIFHRYLGVLFLLIAFVPAWSQEVQPQTPADNSKVNQTDQNASEPTADQQKDNRSDLEITKEIRKSLVGDKSLSTYAHNVKVITQNGKVTLKGPVRSEEEKATVLSKAAQVAGQDNVNDGISIAPKHD